MSGRLLARTALSDARTLSWLAYSRSRSDLLQPCSGMSSSDDDDLTPIEKPRGLRNRQYVTREEANRLLRRVERRRAVRRAWHTCVRFFRWLRTL